MDIGIFAKIFSRPTLEQTLDAVQEHGIRYVQFNMACAGLPSVPESVPPELAIHIREAMASRGLTMTAVSGTFNMIHPDPATRQEGLRRLHALAGACRSMGTSIITLCTGTRDPANMWRWHPENDSPSAWEDLLNSMYAAIQIAEENGVTLVIEPELSNVVNSARRARKLLDEVASPRLKVVMDGSNLLHLSDLPHMPEILHEAFDLLGRDIAVVHAKDLSRDERIGHDAAGTGVMDYDTYIELLQAAKFNGPLILHTLTEPQVDASVAFLRRKLEKTSAKEH